jgi:hypothetical protein
LAPVLKTGSGVNVTRGFESHPRRSLIESKSPWLSDFRRLRRNHCDGRTVRIGPGDGAPLSGYDRDDPATKERP